MQEKAIKTKTHPFTISFPFVPSVVATEIYFANNLPGGSENGL